jgi:DNA-binding HxlR family transcriptional regulator
VCRLRELEEAGLVALSILPQLNRNNGYHLTDRGNSLGEVPTILYEWGETQSAPLASPAVRRYWI